MNTANEKQRTGSRRGVAVLPPDVINQIAAGEVVERPASVVKELLENALDASASVIDVRLEQGGKKRIELSDDGCGMSEQDAVLALERHATSKITSFEDLESVATLGFRGEALPSIASVSRLRLVTSDGSLQGTEVEWDAETSRAVVRPAARSRGTTVMVQDLFENVPARHKFLKSTDAEFRAIVTVLWSYALPHPERSFRVEHNGRVVVDLPAVATLRERSVQVLGSELEPHLVEMMFSIEDCSARGFLTRHSPFGSRRNQYFFVNGRLVRDPVLTHAASRATDAYQSRRHPAIVLFLEVPSQKVDVNVHPAKTEVRFHESGRVHVVVEEAVKRALGAPDEGESLLSSSDLSPRQAVAPPWTLRNGVEDAVRGRTLFVAGEAIPEQRKTYEVTPLFRPSSAVQPPPPPERAEAEMRGGRIIGQYRSSYVLLDGPDGLRLIDQHAAHERVLFERLEEERLGAGPVSQTLLQPFLFDAGAADAAALASHLTELREVGFEVEPFSGQSFAISAVPSVLGRDSLDSFLRKMLDSSFERESSHLRRLTERLNASIACHAAIKAHHSMTGLEMSRLVGDLLDCDHPYACPHGRPVIVDIRHPDIERHFYRK